MRKLVAELIELYEKWIDMKDDDLLYYEGGMPHPPDIYKGETDIINRINEIESELLGDES